MVGDVELHHALALLLQPLGLRMNDKTGHDGRGAGGRCAGAALDLDEAQAAGAEGVDHVGRAKLRDLRAGFHGCAHDRGALWHGDALAVDGEGHRCLGFGPGRTEIDLFNERHLVAPYSAAWRRADAGPKSSLKCFSALMTG